MENIDDLEQLSDSLSLENHDKITIAEQAYIEEVLPLKNEELLTARIDELGNQYPPKAIDSDKNISDIIQPVINEINPIYLEAPSDSVQIEQAAEAMENIEGLSFDEWKELSYEERIEVLQKLENTMAQIEHRPRCPLNVKKMRENDFGYFSPTNLDITMNSRYIKSDSYKDYKECLDTIIHEGRHAYQQYNLTVREVHPREGELTNWKWNEFEMGYRNARIHGFKAYWSQPMECDARAFAEDVLQNYLERK